MTRYPLFMALTAGKISVNATRNRPISSGVPTEIQPGAPAEHSSLKDCVRMRILRPHRCPDTLCG